MSTASKERQARLCNIVKKLFPKVMQHIFKECVSPRGLQGKYKQKFITIDFTENEISLMEKLPNIDDFTIELCYKILRYENVLHEPSCKWGNVPHDTEVEIGDDVQRILNATNDVISRKSEEISELYYGEFHNRTQQVLKRVDEYLCQDTSSQLYQTIHSSDINISDMLQELTLMQAVNDATINMASLDKNRCAKCSMVVMEVFPMIMQELMAHTGTPGKTLYNDIMRNNPFRRNLNKIELDMVDTLMTDEYTKIDVSLSYKMIVNFFQLSIPPPSRQWGANPTNTEIGIGDDIERIRRERNTFVHRVNANISEALFDNFFVTFIEIGKRIDAFLNKPPNNGYAHDVEQCKTCVLDPEVENKLLDAIADIEQLKEKYRFVIGNPGKEIHIFVGKSTEAAIEKIRAEEDLKESYTQLRIIIHEVDDSEEVVHRINSLIDLNHINSENIYFKGVEKGSIILFIDIKNRVVLDDGLFQSEVSTFIQKLFKFCKLTCYFRTQTYAVIAIAAEEFEEPRINLPEKVTRKCLMGNKGHVVVNFEVKNKIFHSPDSLNRTLKGFFNTLLMKGNGKDLLGKTDVYAELVKSEKEKGSAQTQTSEENMSTKEEANAQVQTPEETISTKEETFAQAKTLVENLSTTKESFTQAQTPVKYNLPVSVTLRQQFNIKKSKNGNPDISSCIKTDNTLVFTDYSNNQLIICDSDGTDIHHIPLSYKPWYMTVVNSNTVAVSFRDDSTILIINISTCSVTSTINTSGRCYGMTYNDNNLYVVIDLSIIHVMDLTGKVIRTIPLPSYGIHDITVDRDRLVCIDTTSIYCCSLDGKLIWKLKKYEFQDLRRVTTDNEGNVFETCFNTNTVIVVSDDGKHHRELLTRSDGLDKPWGIYFDKKENILLVCNYRDGQAFLFDVKQKAT
ncbi:uncharacterized protein LOC127707292 [Mytilus californianus]|uniref:uncharacterized protein LOC127707292 n=1 Tax=Mytilus californianus TaxID=6549 RepID=UPI002246B1A0|nr:uncharacterized protein LOC127707292 [Mytilus californianus]